MIIRSVSICLAAIGYISIAIATTSLTGRYPTASRSTTSSHDIWQQRAIIIAASAEIRRGQVRLAAIGHIPITIAMARITLSNATDARYATSRTHI